MSIHIGPHNAVMVDLPRGRDLQGKLAEVSEFICCQDPCDVVMDFARVITFNAVCLTALLWLRYRLRECGRRLIFYHVGRRLYRAFYLTGLLGMFEIAGDRRDALALLRPPLAAVPTRPAPRPTKQ
jgi:anti-anti-sigma regulatory factor